jgi:hypothetical protein
MNIKRLILLILLYFIYNSVNAQKNEFLDGYIVLVNSDTLKGELYFSNKKITSKIVYFKSKELNLKYTPSEIHFFEIYGKSKYLSSMVKYSINSNKIENKKFDKKIIWKEDTEFLEVIVSGKIKLFKFVDKNNKTHFFIQNQNKEIIDLLTLKYEEDGEINTIHKYKNQLKRVLSDCTEIFSLIDDSKLNQKSLLSLIDSYNKCRNITSSYVAEQHTSVLEIYLRGGLTSSKRFLERNKSTNFGGEIGFDIVFPKNDYKWALTNSIGYRIYKAPISLNFNSETVKFQFVRLNLGLKRTLLNRGDIKSNLNGGIINSISIKKPYEGYGIYSQGFFLGFNTFYKNLGLELRFEGKNFWQKNITSFRSEYTYLIFLNYKLFDNSKSR